MHYKSSLYIKDVAILKDYGGKKFKLTLMKSCRQAGVEVKEHKYTAKCTVNTEKLDYNISSARQKIYEYAMCNPWEYFVNLTLDKNKYDRYNLKVYIKDLTQWLRNYSKKFKCDIKYLFIPEQHKDGAWHIHGFLTGLPESHLSNFIAGIHPKKLIDKGYKNWISYSEKFGFVSIDKVKNHEAVSGYITKYVSKDMASNNTELNARLYYCSKGLEKAKTIKKGKMSSNIFPTFENDYVKIQWFEDKQIALSHF